MADIDPELWLLVHGGVADVVEWPVWAQAAFFQGVSRFLVDAVREGWTVDPGSVEDGTDTILDLVERIGVAQGPEMLEQAATDLMRAKTLPTGHAIFFYVYSIAQMFAAPEWRESVAPERVEHLRRTARALEGYFRAYRGRWEASLCDEIRRALEHPEERFDG